MAKLTTPNRVPVAVVSRLVPLTLVWILSLNVVGRSPALGWLVLLTVVAALALVAMGHKLFGPLTRAAETLIVTVTATSLAADPGPGVARGYAAGTVLLYLVVAPACALLRRRTREFLFLLGLASVILAGAAGLDPALRDQGYALACAQWVALTALAGTIVVAQQRDLSNRPAPRPQPYAEATRLLTQLRGVARQLPGATLDPGGIAEHLIEEIKTIAPVSRAAVMSASGGGRLVLLTQLGADRMSWETALDTESAVADAWASQQAHTTSRSQARLSDGSLAGGSEVSVLVVPLIAGVRTVGLVVIEADTSFAYPTDLVHRVVEIAAPSALRLEAALLFDEVRSIATTEERQRLAREIHDGVAQELVMVGYGIDNALAALPDTEAAAEDLRLLRTEVTRVITELRLSLFELRTEVDRYGGLTAAVCEYARTVCASAGLLVHLDVDEPTARLPAAVEAELLRIAQEAITNARKHAGAENLWVTCKVDPPFAQVEVSDDGKGIADPNPEGRYGLAIMRERAERIRGRLEITPRVPNGTTVAVVLGTAPRRGSV